MFYRQANKLPETAPYDEMHACHGVRGKKRDSFRTYSETKLNYTDISNKIFS